MKLRSLLAASILTAGFSLAHADESGWYAGGSIGQSREKNAFGLPGVSLSGNTASGFKVFGGYDINRYWGIEVAYVDFGKVTQSLPAAGIGRDGRASGFNFSGVGLLNLTDNFDLFAKLGAFNSKTKGAIFPAGGSSTTKLSYGLGAKYDFGNNWALRGEVETFNLSTPSAVAAAGRGRAQLVSLGISYKF